MFKNRGLLTLVALLVLYQIHAQIKELTCFMNNDLKIFSTKGLLKAKGLDMTFKYPSSFSIREGDRPDVVGKLRYVGDDYFIQVLLTVVEVDNAKPISEDEKKKVLNPQKLVAFFPFKCDYIDGGYTTFDNEPGSWCLYKMYQSVAGQEGWVTMYMHQILYSNYSITLGYGVSTFNESIDEDKLFSDYIPLFQAIGSSIVFPNKWNGVDEKMRANERKNQRGNILSIACIFLALTLIIVIFLRKRHQV